MFNKGALSLISSYGSDSSDDDVPGPRVSTKRLQKDDEEFCSKKLKRLPLPNYIIKDNEGSNHDHEDDPALHGGRIRTFSHERGNWATYVYIPFENHDCIRELIATMKNTIPDNIGIKEADDFHISLTRTVILRHHWINEFVNSVKLATSSFKRFVILFDGLKIYCNEERTRTFIGLQIRTGHDSLVKIVEALDTCLGEFNLQPFYKDPSFHMSIAWCVGDFEEELKLLLPQLSQHLHDLMDCHSQENWYIYVEYLLCKTGNKYFQFYLT
ncbi:hypothetical protein NQ318_012634 [Aromia moschata]|uniref:U6 snRNA phosphodiesterase n=1 Tax=Aromia moschata TaxID=1265417 RepID=A0AAV8XKB1_9CUCU|nr:hypothetical protein NQ318_012634 [Aromia moschata]